MRLARFSADLLSRRGTFLALVRQELVNRYAGSALGLFWAFAQPLLTILIFWFVFEVGFKSGGVADVPFIVWLATGIIPWFFMAETIVTAPGAVVEKPFLVSKVRFRVSWLPLIKVLAALFVHLAFLPLLVCLYAVYGLALEPLHLLQLCYYVPAMVLLMTGLGFLTASLNVFFRDVAQLAQVAAQFGFWLTPIFWNVAMVPQGYKGFIQANPFFYITEGYRDSFLATRFFWERPVETASFWTVTLLLCFLGGYVFTRTRPVFADEL